MRKENEAAYYEFAAQKEPNGLKKPVRCVETGQVFQSAEAAAKAFGANVSAIRNVCCGYAKTACGKHFEYVDPAGGSSLCWKCANAYGGCCWTGRDENGAVRFQPVPGWTAEETSVSIGGGRREKSFRVISCPEFLPDALERSGASG